MKQLICKWFGHKPHPGYGNRVGYGYLIVKLGVIDGMGVRHAALHDYCSRCGNEYQVGLIHVPKNVYNPLA